MVAATLAAIRRAEQVYFEQIAERCTLEYGIAFYAPEYPEAPGDNAFREVLVDTEAGLAPAWSEVSAFYGARQLTCRRWVPSSEQNVELLADFLAERGLAPRRFVAMRLRDWPHLPVNEAVRVLPARAMRKAFRALHDSPSDAGLSEQRLDDAQFDVSVALLDGQPAGRCGLLQVGEIGYICDLYVAESFRRRGVATRLLDEVLQLARRLMMKVVCAKVPAGHGAALALCEAHGFIEDGVLFEFDRVD